MKTHVDQNLVRTELSVLILWVVISADVALGSPVHHVLQVSLRYTLIIAKINAVKIDFGLLFDDFILFVACVEPADVTFLLDSSGSVGEENFNKMKEFLKDLLQDIDLITCNYQISVLKVCLSRTVIK